MSDTTTETVRASESYLAARDAAWEAQRVHRNAAAEEIRRLMPEGVQTVVFTINDTPRLALDAYRDAQGEEIEVDQTTDPLADLIDTIASETECRDWYDAADFLHTDHADPNNRFIIERLED